MFNKEAAEEEGAAGAAGGGGGGATAVLRRRDALTDGCSFQKSPAGRRSGSLLWKRVLWLVCYSGRLTTTAAPLFRDGGGESKQEEQPVEDGSVPVTPETRQRSRWAGRRQEVAIPSVVPTVFLKSDHL